MKSQLLTAIPWTWTLIALMGGASTACDGDPIDLTVDVRTDYVAGRDFSMVVTEIGAPSFTFGAEVRTASMPADGAEDFLRGERVAELSEVPSGDISVRVRLMNSAGAVVAQRIVALALQRSYAVTVLITSNCAGVSCPAPAGSPALTECLDGACVDPRCSPSAPEYCPPACESADDCALRVECSASMCIEGTCFCSGPRRRDDDGGMLIGDASLPLDAGPSCECVPGTVLSDMLPCGNCDSGVRTRTRTCDDTCTFQAWSDFGACTDESGCMPGTVDTERRGCGNCGLGAESRTRTCDASCAYGAWSAYGACSGGGACAPGATRGCPNGDSCGNEVCNGSCAWGGCVPRAGAQCLRIAPGRTTEGTNFRCCGANQWQYCLAGCVWSTACTVCGSSCSC